MFGCVGVSRRDGDILLMTSTWRLNFRYHAPLIAFANVTICRQCAFDQPAVVSNPSSSRWLQST
eukprot:m.54813 g.54813  ORF g.54813 m.54813 type:complete len:64 (+) comp34405_c0_seq2:3388-3579(+)